jgi:hypothetical protein
MQYLAEPTAATLKGCGIRITTKTSRKPKKQSNITFQGMVGLKLMFEILGFTSFFFGVTSKKQNNSTLIGFLDKTMELKW